MNAGPLPAGDVTGEPTTEPTVDPATDPTRDVLALLHTWQTAHRPRWRDRLYVLYVAALVAGLYVLPMLDRAADTGGGPLAELLPRSATTALAFAGLVFTALSCLAAVDGAHRGPLVVAPPALHWLLETPVSRPTVLRRRWTRAWATWVAIGAATAFAVAFVVRLGAAGPHRTGVSVPGLSVATLAGAAFGAICAAVAGAVQLAGDGRVGQRLRLLFAAPVALAAVCWLLSAGGARPAFLGSVLVWSGPWGWTARVVTGTATPEPSDAGTWSGTGTWSVTGLLLVAAVSATLWGRSRVPRLPGVVLRSRVERLQLMTSAVYNLDFRLVRVVMQGAPARPGRLPLPAPRRPWQLAWWRVSAGWTRRPAATLVGAALVSAAVWLAAVSNARPDPAGVLATIAQLGTLYAGVGALAEAIRCETDDVGRSRARPDRFRTVVLALAVPPALVSVGLVCLGCTVTWLAAPDRVAGPLALLGSVPALMAAAVLSACRGPFPLQLLIGSDTPVGNTGPLQAALWYARAPVAAFVATAPFVWWAVGPGTAAPWLESLGAAAALGYLALVSTGLAWWARTRANGLYLTWR